MLERVEAGGLLQFITSFAPYRIGTQPWARSVAETAGGLKLLVDFFLLGKVVDRCQLDNLIADVELLIEFGIARAQETRVVIPSLVLVYVCNQWMFVQRPQPNPTIYIGHDTFALMSRLRVRPGMRFLDLCSGPGTQGIWAGRQGASVVCIERNPVAAEVARVNVELNDLIDRMEVRVADLYAGLVEGRDERFDAIAMNPPLLPFPNDQFYPFVGHGGEDGLVLTWKLLDGLQTWLKPQGVATVIGTCFSDGLMPCCISALSTVSQVNHIQIDMTATAHVPFHPGTVTFDGLVQTSMAAESGSSAQAVRTALDRIRREVDATHLCFFSLSARLSDAPTCNFVDLSPNSSHNSWFVE